MVGTNQSDVSKIDARLLGKVQLEVAIITEEFRHQLPLIETDPPWRAIL
jgi:hypothetical protein